MLTLKYHKMPTFHELWKDCMERHLTSSTDDMVELLKECGVSRSSPVLDTCVGGGALGVELLSRGFNLTTADGSAEMLTLFREKLATRGIRHEPVLAQWDDFPQVFRDRRFDALICCGNSLIYAGGHWNYNGEVDREQALAGITETLAIFRGLLSPGDVLIVDKPADDEAPTEEKIAELCVAESDVYNVYFSVRFDPSGECRTAQILLRHQVTGQELGTPNVAYRLKDDELLEMLHRAGFTVVECRKSGVNSHFPLFIARA